MCMSIPSLEKSLVSQINFWHLQVKFESLKVLCSCLLSTCSPRSVFFFLLPHVISLISLPSSWKCHCTSISWMASSRLLPSQPLWPRSGSRTRAPCSVYYLLRVPLCGPVLHCTSTCDEYCESSTRITTFWEQKSCHHHLCSLCFRRAYPDCAPGLLNV